MTPTQTEVHKWTVEEFERKVFESRPKVAVFDCDGTLWGHDSGHGFMVWSLDQGLVSRSTQDWIDTRYRGYRAGSVSEEEICGDMVLVYAGLHDEELRAAAGTYFNTFILERIFPEMTRVTELLRAAGVALWAVSSTNRWVIGEAVGHFGIPLENILAAEVRVNNGIATSELVDVPTGPAKAAALRRAGIPHPDAVFGNSIHDVDMLEMARCAFPVNPSPSLLKAAAKHGWGYYRPLLADGHEATVGGE